MKTHIGYEMLKISYYTEISLRDFQIITEY